MVKWDSVKTLKLLTVIGGIVYCTIEITSPYPPTKFQAISLCILYVVSFCKCKIV